MKKRFIFIMAMLISFGILSSQSLYDGVEIFNPEKNKKTIRARCTDIGMACELYSQITDDCKVRFVNNKWEKYNTAIAFMYNGKEYYLPVTNEELHRWDTLGTEDQYYFTINDSIELDILIFPFLNDYLKCPLGLVTQVRKLDETPTEQ